MVWILGIVIIGLMANKAIAWGIGKTSIRMADRAIRNFMPFGQWEKIVNNIFR